MTIAELYEYAKENDIENLPVIIVNECADYFYSFDVELSKGDIKFSDTEVTINL